jgi:hypothetical protein
LLGPTSDSGYFLRLSADYTEIFGILRPTGYKKFRWSFVNCLRLGVD